jgi:phosphohistidine phosphatase
MRHLLIMRHAKSDWDTRAKSDFDRPLSKRGKHDAPRMGRWLLENKLIPDWILSSPALRAKETALHVCKALGIKTDAIHWQPAIYEAELKSLLGVLAQCPKDKQLTLLIGHNPGLESLLDYLAEGTTAFPANKKRMPTAAIAYLELPNDWDTFDRGRGKLKALTYPKALPDA